jgi:hypothetical protein
MIFTNIENHGGNFYNVLDKEFSKAQNVSIASGYVSLDIMEHFSERFLSIARNGGTTKLLLGMAFYEGLSKKKLDLANSLNEELRNLSSSSGIYVSYGRRYHGKVYKFASNERKTFYVGSSNFSSSGTKGNIECTIPVIDANQNLLIDNFLDELYSDKFCLGIHEANIPIFGQRKIILNKTEKIWKNLHKHQFANTKIKNLPKFTIDLARIADKEKSNLNIYFGKGRWNRSNNKITPRAWYEVELIADKSIINNPNYPRGDFNAFTDDNLIIPMRTQGANNKNIRSRDSLQIFGIWLKGKLEKNGALNKYEPVTLETLIEYGNSKIIFYKINESDYYMSF